MNQREVAEWDEKMNKDRKLVHNIAYQNALILQSYNWERKKFPIENLDDGENRTITAFLKHGRA